MLEERGEELKYKLDSHRDGERGIGNFVSSDVIAGCRARREK